MDTQKLCQSCQTPLAPDAPRGLCPACLMKVAMATGTEAGPEQPGFTPPGIEELARKFPQLELIELIGRGGMGAVYKARQKELDRVVALKILPPGIGEDAAFAERFAREAKALARLNHPGIVTIHDFGRAEGLYFFVMEFVDGVNLRQLLATGRVSAREALAIVPQICDALQYAHDQGIVHRDIKPENVLLDRRGRVKVADFGLAKLVGSNALTPSLSHPMGEGGAPAPGEGTQPTASLTDAGKVMGTPAYMAPEQVEHPAEVDHRADIYALGVVFYQMLTGELPGRRIEPPSRKVQIDVRLDEVVLRALEKKPELRYQQVSEVKTCVETIAGTPAPGPGGRSQTGSEGRQTAGQPPGERRVPSGGNGSQRPPWPLIMVAALFMLYGGCAAWEIGSGLHERTFSANFNILGLSVGIGLLRLRPRWRVVALILIWLPFVLGAFIGIVALFGQFPIAAHATFFGHQLTGFAWLAAAIATCTLVPLLLVWMSRTLTRPEVKALFQGTAPRHPGLEWAVLPVAILLAYVLSSLAGPVRSAPFGSASPLVEVSATPSFGPVREGWIAAPGAGLPCVLNFETGRYLDVPKDIGEALSKYAFSPDASASQWLRDNGGDAILAPDDTLRFVDGLVYYPTLNGRQASWEELTPDRVLRLLDGVEDKEERQHSVKSITSLRATLRPPSAMVFTTRAGSIGVLQLLDSRDNPRRVDFRYQLLRGARAKAGVAKSVAPAAERSEASFGPVLERVLVDSKADFGSEAERTNAPIMINFGSGSLLAGPAAMWAADTSLQRTWMVTNGVDALAVIPGVNGLVGLDMKAVSVPLEAWDDLSASSVVERLAHTNSNNTVLFGPGQSLPPTWLFQTREGSMGVLQLTGFTDHPRGVKIRYKLVHVPANSAALKPIPPQAAELWAAFKAYTTSYLQTHHMKDTNVQAAFSKETTPRIKQMEALLAGTVAAPLLQQQHERLADMLKADRLGDLAKSRDAANHAKALGTQIEKLLAAAAKPPVPAIKLPTFQLRWVAVEGDTNSPVEVLRDSSGRELRVLPEVVLSSQDVQSAGFIKYQVDQKELSVILTPLGGQKFATATATNIGRQLAIVWNGRVVSAPVVREAITGREVSVNGLFSDAEANQLLELLNHRTHPTTSPEFGPAYGREQDFRHQLADSAPVKQYGYHLKEVRFSQDYQEALVVFAQPDSTTRPEWEFTLKADSFGRYRGTWPGTANESPVSITVDLADK